jgi:antitoxin (DNA-binding transcriptional repressor) of toxin-antitoxin stability system
MKTVDVRTLQHRLGWYLDEVERGEILEVRRRRKIIARIVPHSGEDSVDPWPDLMARLAGLYPDGPVRESAAERLYADREGS